MRIHQWVEKRVPTSIGKIVALARAGRNYSSLTREFELWIQWIRKWVEQINGKIRAEDRDLARRNQRLERENATLREGCDIVAKDGLVRAGDQRDCEEIYQFMSAYWAELSLAAMCRVLRVSRTIMSELVDG